MNLDSPAVSVIIPTYNRCDLLRYTIASVLNQTFADLELIVVDDGSTNDTLTFLASIDDSRMRCIALPHRGNVAAARNAGASLARGRFLGFLDSDDLWQPKKLEVQVARMSAARVRWSYTRFDHIDQAGMPVPARAGQWRELSGNIANEMIKADAPVVMPTVLVERELFDQVGRFDEDPRMLREDYDLMVRLSVAAETLAIPQLLVRVREHAGRSTSTWSTAASFMATAAAYDKLLTILTDRNQRRAAQRRRGHQLAEAGARYLHAGSIGLAARCFFRSALDRPNPRQWLSALLRGARSRRLKS